MQDDGTSKQGTGALRLSRSRLAFAAAMVCLAAVFAALGTWQVQRLFWKLDLIARVDARVHAPAAPPPAPGAWTARSASEEEYRHVTVQGRFEHGKEALVQAVTKIGPGFWVITPLVTQDGTTILINRGFVPPERRNPRDRAEGQVAGPTRVTGLLRISEPGGGFLRSNDPAGDRWYSRDVAAIAAARGLSGVAPYFIDADDGTNPGGFPVGGLTVVQFPNSHLSYAITWYVLALMSFGAAYGIARNRLR